MDGAPPSVGSDSCPSSLPQTPSSQSLNTPSTVKKPIKIFQKRMVTGYIIYSGEVRKNFAAKNPDATFGEVSRLVGNEWRNLPTHVKSEYEERSQRINEETAAEMARNGTDNPPATVSTSGEAVPQGDAIFECFWKKCDWQGEEIGELTEHLLSEPHGHAITTINPNGNETFILLIRDSDLSYLLQIRSFSACGADAAESAKECHHSQRWSDFYAMSGRFTLSKIKDASCHPMIATSMLQFVGFDIVCEPVIIFVFIY